MIYCSLWTLNWVFFENIWKRCCLRFRPSINESLSIHYDTTQAFAEQPHREEVVVDLAKPLVQAEPTHRAHVQTTILTQETFEEVDAAAAPEQPTEEHIVVSPFCSDLVFSCCFSCWQRVIFQHSWRLLCGCEYLSFHFLDKLCFKVVG